MTKSLGDFYTKFPVSLMKTPLSGCVTGTNERALSASSYLKSSVPGNYPPVG